MKAANVDWATSWGGTDDYEFGVLPTGGRADGSFNWLGSLCRFWTSSQEPTNSTAAVCWEFNSSASMSKSAANKTNYVYSVRLVNYPPPKGGWASCLAIITESCLGAIGLHFGIGPCSGEACSRHSARLWVLARPRKLLSIKQLLTSIGDVHPIIISVGTSKVI